MRKLVENFLYSIKSRIFATLNFDYHTNTIVYVGEKLNQDLRAELP